MPMSRYEVRNEYSLADPELYRAADKDDPEALLEGVAMAGLVGVLRQLGDLAEFAAEIFHNLHEDVMATASRGHTLAFRVQQLEMEIPSLERALLSQTDHSSFFYHSGVDWHPNLRPDDNLVTQGDMPRFIMDSYEECRAPPRLFLLDKFDVAGAGACLKRYTDPSFFKVETSEMTSADIQKEKKIRKAKKKGPRWRNRETCEVLPTSHTKLHQLFLEERVENGISTTSRLAKLKRRLNGFPFNSKSGESYMEKILRSPSSDHEVLHDMPVEISQQQLAPNDHNDSAYNMFEFRPASPYRMRGERKRSTPTSPDREIVAQNPLKYDSDESLMDDEICEIPNSHPNVATNGIASALDELNDETVVPVDAESNGEGSFTGNESDDMASEIDNFVDAPSTMDSEMDRDSDMRMKRDETSRIRTESLITDAYEEPLHSRSSDSQSTGDTTMSDVGNNSSTKEVSNFSSGSPSISAEKPQSESSSTKGFQCTDISVNEVVDASCYQETADEDFPVHHSKPVTSDDTLTEIDAFTNCRSESRQVSSSLCNDGSIPLKGSEIDELVRKRMLSDEKVSTLDDEEENIDPSIGQACVASNGPCTEANAIANQRSDSDQVHSTLWLNGSVPTLELSGLDEVVGDHKIEVPGSDEMVSMTDDKEKMINLVVIPPVSPSARISRSQSEDDLSQPADEEQTADEPNDQSIACLSPAYDIYHHATDSSVKISSNLLHEDESDGEYLDLADDAASTLNIPDVLSTSGNHFQDKFEDGFPHVPEICPSDYPDGARDEDNIEPKGDKLIGAWDDEVSNVSIDSRNHNSYIIEASFERGFEETSSAFARTLTVEDNHSNSSTHNETSLEDLKLSRLANSPDSPMEGLDALDEDNFSEEDTTVNETLPVGIPESCEAVCLQSVEISYRVSPNDSETVEVSHCTSEDLKEPAGASDIVEMDGISLSSGLYAQEVTGISNSVDLQPANDIRELLNKSGDEADTSNTADITSPSSAVSEVANLSKLVEECNDCFEDSGIHELENDEICPSEGESDHVEKVGLTEASASGFGTIIHNSVDNDHPESEPSSLIPNSHLEFDQSPTEQCGLDRKQERFNENGLENQVSDAPSLPVDNCTEESVQLGLPSSRLDQHLLHSSEISPELSPSPPMNYLRVLDNGDGKEESNLVSGFSPVNGSSPPLFPELSRLSNEIIVPGYPTNPFSSIAPPSNPFLQENPKNLSDLPPLPPLPPVQWMMGKLQHAPSLSEEEILRNEESFPQSISTTTAADDGSSPPTASTDNVISSREEVKDLETELSAETISKEKSLENSITSSEAKTLPEKADLSSNMENRPQLLATPIPESVSTSSAAENGSQKVKFRPRNPLVDDVSFLDKSKLRKVTERVRPEIQKVEERDSLLEQIRTKSFNLKPAMASRPSIRARGPNTNLKVVAILEKANAIRQAFAGSDEDDDDSWSE